MPTPGQPPDTRDRFVRLLAAAVIAAVIGCLGWGLLSVGGRIVAQTRGMRCQKRLRTLAEAMTIYRSLHGDLPAYLALLIEPLEGRTDTLICPADPGSGRNGCRPEWLRRYDNAQGDNAFANVDLDGPGLDPETAADTIPCSYLYAANGYPCGLAGFAKTWRALYDEKVNQFGVDAPLVRCYHHLPEQYTGVPAVPDPGAHPTYNITADLEVRQYPLDWEMEAEAALREPQ